MNKSQEKNIIEYLQFYASSELILERGENIFNNDAVQYLYFDKKQEKHYFHVQGTKLYTTYIKNVGKKNMETSCSCPYTWGQICKHEVAVLLYAIKNFNEQGQLTEKVSEAIKRKNYRDPEKMIEINPINNVSVFVDKNEVNLSRPNSFDIKSVKIAKKRITFAIERYSFGKYYEKSKIDVYFIFDKGKLLMFSTEHMPVKKNTLKPSEYFVLQAIINTGQVDIFDLFFNKREIFMKQATAKFKLPATAFNKFFEFYFDNHRGLRIRKKDKSLLLFEQETNPISPILEKLPDFELRSIKTYKKDFALGFVLEKSYHNGYYYDAIVAKYNKNRTKLISRFSYLSETPELIKLSHEENIIIDNIKKYKNGINNHKIDFVLSKNIFQSIASQKFIFLNNFQNTLRKYDLTEIKLSPTTVSLVIKVSSSHIFVSADIAFRINDQIIDINKIDDFLEGDMIIRYQHKYYHLNDEKSVVLLHNAHEGFKASKKLKDVFYQKIIQPLAKDFEIIFCDETFKHKIVSLDYQSEQVFLSEVDDYIVIRPQVVYDRNITVLLTHQGNPVIKNEETGKISEYIRNFEQEQQFVEYLSTLHPDFDEQKNENVFYLHHEDFIDQMWFYHFFENLKNRDVEIYGLKDLKKFKYSPYRATINTGITSGQDWFDVNIELSFGDSIVKISELKKAILNKQKYILLKDGSVGILPEEWLEKLQKYFRHGQLEKDTLKISKLRFSIIDELFDQLDESEIFEEILKKKARLKQFSEIADTTVPAEIKAKLRPYQKEGLNWLHFLDEMKWGGILADDMGLGKTLQILTFIQNIVKNDKTPNLIVVPTTLLFNWKAEIEKFAPALKAYYYYGVDREKKTTVFKKYDMVFTTYGTLMRDIELLRNYKFNYIILDESQAIKNPASRRYKAVNLLQSNNRVAMTGTPIENSTFDLFAQMNFVNPGFFGSINDFKKQFSSPIDKEGNHEIANELQKLINPFILRRTKENVAKELPPKIEDVIYCEMETEQRKIYDAYKNEYREKLLNNVAEKGIGKSKLMVLEALTRLRQICDSPALIDQVDYNEKSIKIKEIIEHIKHKTAQHKVLIFSQFVKMLHLIRDELDRYGISYEYLDGKSSSKQREKSVQNFQSKSHLRVFLISLKAGGTGLNLTAADYVYIVDPWWNPAVENQAIDRTYRIGQDKNVFAYRMICKDTVEEKILDLQAKKLKIATDIIQAEENIMKSLDINDLKELFS